MLVVTGRVADREHLEGVFKNSEINASCCSTEELGTTMDETAPDLVLFCIEANFFGSLKCEKRERER